MDKILIKKLKNKFRKKVNLDGKPKNNPLLSRDWDNELNNGGRIRLQKKCSSGQASLEFILVIPILILVILAVSQLGHLIYTQNIMEQAVREASRVISTTNSNQRAYQQVYRICSGLDKNKIDIGIVPSDKSMRKVGDMVEVCLTYRYSGFFNLISTLTGKSILVSASSKMRMECN